MTDWMKRKSARSDLAQNQMLHANDYYVSSLPGLSQSLKDKLFMYAGMIPVMEDAWLFFWFLRSYKNPPKRKLVPCFHLGFLV